jgi:hypothetical protein
MLGMHMRDRGKVAVFRKDWTSALHIAWMHDHLEGLLYDWMRRALFGRNSELIPRQSERNHPFPFLPIEPEVTEIHLCTSQPSGSSCIRYEYHRTNHPNQLAFLSVPPDLYIPIPLELLGKSSPPASNVCQ